MQTPATPLDLTARGLTGVDPEVAETWLDVAWRALQREIVGISARVESGEVDTDDVKDVVCAATLRVLRNPEGFTQESSQIDDYSESFTRSDASQDVYFTSAELRRIQPAALPAAGSFGYA